MGVDFVAILGHSLDNSTIVSLPNRWNSDPNIRIATTRFCQFLTRKGWFSKLSVDNTWFWEVSYDKKWEGTNAEEIWNSGDVVLQGLGILALHFGRGALYLSAPLRFAT